MFRCLLLICCAPLLLAQSDEIRAMLKNSEAAWNRGDLVAFASDYEDLPTTTFVGKEVTRGGTQAILGRYRRGYPTPEAMGKLTFSEIEVRPLGKGYAANGRGRRRCQRPVHVGAAKNQGRVEDRPRPLKLAPR
jgi:hypothetical protein